MDYLLMKSTDTVYPIFKAEFDSALSENDKQLKRHIESMLMKCGATDAMQCAAWQKLKKLCVSLGMDGAELEPEELKAHKHTVSRDDHDFWMHWEHDPEVKKLC